MEANQVSLKLGFKPWPPISSALVLIILAMQLLGCASYHMGSVGRGIPGGYNLVSVPIFKNHTQETGIEVGFTSALIQEFQYSKVVRVVDDNLSEVRIVGTIDSVDYLPGGALVPSNLTGVVIATTYNVAVKATIKVIRQADGLELWSGSFGGQATYSASQVTLAGVNSVNPLYNLSARRQNIDIVAGRMMAEAHDRLSENF